MNTIANIFAATLFSLVVFSSAMADSFYGAFDFGQTTAKDSCNTTGLPAGTTVSGCKDTANLYRIAGGYQFDPMWGAEVSYGAYGKASLGNANIPGLGTIAAGDWQTTGIQISGTGTFPLGSSFSFTGKIGLARTDLKLTAFSISSTSTNLAFGIGAQLDFSKSLAIRVQYEDLGTIGDANTTGTAKATLLSAGIVLRF